MFGPGVTIISGANNDIQCKVLSLSHVLEPAEEKYDKMQGVTALTKIRTGLD